MLFGTTGTTISKEETMQDVSLEAIMENAIREALSEEELSEFLSDQSAVTEAIDAEILTERTIVKLDKNAKFQKAYKAAIFSIAQEKNDPKFKKLLTVWKMERYLEAYLEKKYSTAAKKRARETMRKASKVKSNPIKKVAKKVSGTFNKEVPKEPKMPSMSGIPKK